MGTITADFSGDTVVVTGASPGIGRAVAVGFGEAGATVINADVRAEPKDRNAETAVGDVEWEHSHYATTKGAVEMLSRSAALELAEHDVRATAVAPGPIATEVTEGWSQRGADSVGGGREPSTRAGRLEDLTDAYRSLASEGADYVTGEVLWVDGASHV